MANPPYNNFSEVIPEIANKLLEIYWDKIRAIITSELELLETVPKFLLEPDEIIFYFGKTHLAIEYTGQERFQKDETLRYDSVLKVRSFDYSQSQDNFLEKIIGFEYDDSTAPINLTLASILEYLIMPTNRGIEKLQELKWNFGVQDSMTMFNIGHPIIMENEFFRIINGLFFDAGEHGLKTRHIKWLDCIPLSFDDSDDVIDKIVFDFSPFNELAKIDSYYKYPLPDDYDFCDDKLQRINRLIEIVGREDSSETEITQFLAKKENQFILTMRFGASEVFSEVPCEWQSETKKSIRPDFFVVQPNGYADIVEFKLPTVELKTVGKENREVFTAKLNSYISQTRAYRNYFDDPNNRAWFESAYGYKVNHPRRILVVGRRWQFDNDVWKEIVSDHRDVEIMTYEDLVDGVVAQFYK